MAHVYHARNVQDSFLTQLEQRKRLDDAFAAASAVLHLIRELRGSPESINLAEQLRDASDKVAHEVAAYVVEVHEARRQQVEFEFGGQS